MQAICVLARSMFVQNWCDFDFYLRVEGVGMLDVKAFGASLLCYYEIFSVLD